MGSGAFWSVLLRLAAGVTCRTLGFEHLAPEIFSPQVSPLHLFIAESRQRGWLNVWQHMWKSLKSLSTSCQWHGGKSCKMTCDGLGLARGRVGMEGGRPSVTPWVLPENSYSSAVKLRTSFCFSHNVRLNIFAGNCLWVWVIKKHLQCQ